MSVITVAILIVASFLGAVVWFAFGRDARSSAAFGLALLVYGIILALGPRTLGG